VWVHGERPAVVSLPRVRSLAPARLLPSGRSLLLGLALVAVGAVLYMAARTTSMFAIQRVEVTGLAPGPASEVRQALAPLEGRSLVTLDSEELARRLAALPIVRSFTYDRDFPHTLRVAAVAERPVAVLRRGGESWLVSAGGRVLARVPAGFEPALARIWVSRAVDVGPGVTLDDPSGGLAARAVGVGWVMRLPDPVHSVRPGDELVLTLRSGLELRLGTARDLALKLAIAAQILPRLDLGARYLDVSVPERPVAPLNSQVAG
jgi:cell division protein FtsQ